MSIFKKQFSFCLAVILSLSLIVPAPVFSLSPDSKDFLDSLPKGVGEDSFRRFNSIPKIDSSLLPPWLRFRTSAETTHDSLSLPSVAPSFPFPNMEAGIGVHDPHWLKISLLGSAILDAGLKQGDAITLGQLRLNVQAKYQMYNMFYSDTELLNLLNNLRRINIVKNKTGHDFVMDDDSEIVLSVPERMLAVWADDAAYIGSDLKNSIESETAVKVIEDYATITSQWNHYPIEANYPVLRAVALLEKGLQEKVVGALRSKYSEEGKNITPLVDSILLLLDYSKSKENWLDRNANNLSGRTIYSIAAEIALLAGGLGRVMQYHGAGLKRLGADVVYIEPMYRRYKDGTEIKYESLPLPIKGLKMVVELETNVQSTWVKFEVWQGINEFGVPVYFIKDSDSNNLHFKYADKLYTYRDFFNHHYVTAEEFTEFFAKASLELIRFLEMKKKKEKGDKWNPPIIDANDGQIIPLSAWAQIYYRDSEKIRDKHGALDPDSAEIASIFSQILISSTTHTYRNRINLWIDPVDIVQEDGRIIIKNYGVGLRYLKRAGITDEYLWLFLRKGVDGKLIWDFTSAGLRGADIAKGVAAIHAYEVGKWDPSVELFGITNGDNIPYSIEYFVESMRELGISPLDYYSLTPSQIVSIKKKAKEKLGLNPEQMVVSYSGRLVPEKAGRHGAFTSENIREMVRKGIQVVIYGNVQPYPDSLEIGDQYDRLKEELDREGLPGRFVFKRRFSIDEQRRLLAATDIQVQYSDRGTGASEYTEADVSANGGLQFSTPYWEGIINKQGLAVNWQEMTGNTIVAQDDSPRAFISVMMLAFSKFESGDLSKLQKNSISLSRILDASLTSAAYLRWWNSRAGKKTKIQPRILGELNQLKDEDVNVVSIKGVDNITRDKNRYNIEGDGSIELAVNVNLRVHNIIRPGETQVIDHNLVQARIADKYGKIIPLKLKEIKGEIAVFSVQLSDLPINGNIEISSGLWWVKYPISIVRAISEDKINKLDESIKKNTKIKLISPEKTGLEPGDDITIQTGEPVILQIEFPCESEEFAAELLPVLYANIFGKWEDTGEDRFLFSEKKYLGGKLIWTFSFTPENSGELTFYVTSKKMSSVKIWHSKIGKNITVNVVSSQTDVGSNAGKNTVLGDRYAGFINMLKLIFGDIKFPSMEEIAGAGSDKIERDFFNTARAKGITDEDLTALLILIGDIVQKIFTDKINDNEKRNMAIYIATNVIKNWQGLAFNKLLSLWNRLSSIGYAKYTGAIAQMMAALEGKRFIEYQNQELMLIYFLSAVMGDDLRKITKYKGIDYARTVSDDRGLMGKVNNNVLQSKILASMKKKKFSGVIVQDIKDYGTGVSNWLRAIERHKIDISGVKMVYLLNGLSISDREKLLKSKPEGVIFAEKIEDVEGENVVYLSRFSKDRADELKKKSIKLVERGNCGPILELSMALNLLSLDKIYDSSGNLNNDAIELYINFLHQMESNSIIETQVVNRYVDEIRKIGYIKLPDIRPFEEMWYDMSAVEIYA
jgi:hypothetical protein